MRRAIGFGFLAFVLGAAVLLIGILGAAYAIDPYDTGRSGLLKKPSVRPQ